MLSSRKSTSRTSSSSPKRASSSVPGVSGGSVKHGRCHTFACRRLFCTVSKRVTLPAAAPGVRFSPFSPASQPFEQVLSIEVEDESAEAEAAEGADAAAASSVAGFLLGGCRHSVKGDWRLADEPVGVVSAVREAVEVVAVFSTDAPLPNGVDFLCSSDFRAGGSLLSAGATLGCFFHESKIDDFFSNFDAATCAADFFSVTFFSGGAAFSSGFADFSLAAPSCKVGKKAVMPGPLWASPPPFSERRTSRKTQPLWSVRSLSSSKSWPVLASCRDSQTMRNWSGGMPTLAVILALTSSTVSSADTSMVTVLSFGIATQSCRAVEPLPPPRRACLPRPPRPPPPPALPPRPPRPPRAPLVSDPGVSTGRALRCVS